MFPKLPNFLRKIFEKIVNNRLCRLCRHHVLLRFAVCSGFLNDLLLYYINKVCAWSAPCILFLQKRRLLKEVSPVGCWGTRTRTKNDRTRICSVTITPYPNGFICGCKGSAFFRKQQNFCGNFYKKPQKMSISFVIPPNCSTFARHYTLFIYR